MAVSIVLETKTFDYVPKYIYLGKVISRQDSGKTNQKRNWPCMKKILETKFHSIRQPSNDGNKGGGAGMLCAPDLTLWSPDMVPD
jgi:hypothetical protein